MKGRDVNSATHDLLFAVAGANHIMALEQLEMADTVKSGYLVRGGEVAAFLEQKQLPLRKYFAELSVFPRLR